MQSLLRQAGAQGGLFTTRQAQEAGLSRARLAQRLKEGTFDKVARGIYRVAHLPVDEQEELIAAWLATHQQGIFSHETALFLHGLSDALPARAHLTVPPGQRRRRFAVEFSPHFDEVPGSDRTWIGAVPVTSVPRTLRDSVRAGVQADFVEAAMNQALDRGLITEADVEEAQRELRRTSRCWRRSDR